MLDSLKVQNIISSGSFSKQASLLTSELWGIVFPSAPRLLYIPLENLVLKYLLEVFQDPDNFLSRLVLTPRGRELWQKYFAQEHTFLFWAIDADGRRRALSSLPESPSELLNLIKQRKVYPASPLCFAVLLKAGIVCAGGFTQTSWLTSVKGKLVKLLGELPNVNSALAIEKIPTKNFAESSLAWLKLGPEYITPTAVDLFFAGADMYPKYLGLAEKLTLSQSLMLAMPTIYSVVVPKNEQMPGFNLEVARKQAFAKSEIQNLLTKAGI